MRVLGIDPGLRVTGYGLLEANGMRARVLEAGVVRSDDDASLPDRLRKIHLNVLEIIRELEPEAIAVEELYSHYGHPTTAILMGHARGAICLISGVHRIPLVNYPSTRIKKAVTGNGQASKRQVQRMVQTLLKLERPPEPADVSDALAMAISYIYTSQHALVAK